MEDLIVNFDEIRERAGFSRTVKEWRGVKRITVREYRRTRTNRQNRFYWGPVLGAFVEYRQEQGEEYDTEMAHKFFGWKFLRQQTTDTETGEVLGWTIRSTTKLNTAEMSEYVEKILAWLADYGITVDRTGHEWH